MKKPNSVVMAAIAALVIIEIAAMSMGFNGTLRMIIVGAIAGLAGWRVPTGVTK